MDAIETSSLTHHFRAREIVLRDIELKVPEGCIYGFLGPNGAGKTTTLRLVLGLLRLQQGTIHVLGQPFSGHRVEILRRVGSSIESPSLYAHLTAVENLKIWQTVFGCPMNRVHEVLRLVSLADTGRKLAGEFSLGMKQRLSIAIALLHEPALLILDEPTNGLDPHGMNEMRELLTVLNRERGTTIVVSSHLLSEVERLVNHVGIIKEGALVFQGSLAALVSRQRAASFTTIDTDDNPRALAALAALDQAAEFRAGKILMPALAAAQIGRLNAKLVQQGISVHEIATTAPNLEGIFMDLIGN